MRITQVGDPEMLQRNVIVVSLAVCAVAALESLVARVRVLGAPGAAQAGLSGDGGSLFGSPSADDGAARPQSAGHAGGSRVRARVGARRRAPREAAGRDRSHVLFTWGVVLQFPWRLA